MLERLAWVSLALGALVSGGLVGACAEASSLPDDADEASGGAAGEGGSNGEELEGNGGSGGLLSCAGVVYEAEKSPVDLYFMMDRSESMGVTHSDIPARWPSMQQAIEDFVEQPEAAGIGMGMGFFPHQLPNPCNEEGTACNEDGSCGPEGASCLPCFLDACMATPPPDSCETSDYATPALGIAPLPGAAAGVVQAVTDAELMGTTPTSAALAGALEHATAWAQEHPERVVAVVLATDGEPSSCDTEPEVIGNLATQALNGPSHVRTFVIGIGTNLTALDAVAAAGGTHEAHLIDADDFTSDDLVAAFDEVRVSALACSFAIPKPKAGRVDKSLINVSYTTPDDEEHVIPQVSTAAKCPKTEPAWYYDNPTNPSQILLCGGACDAVRADAQTTAEILVGCETIVR